MEIPLCLNDVDSFFIGVIIDPFNNWVISVIGTSILAILASFIGSRYALFQSKKTEYISELFNTLYPHSIKYCHKWKKKIFYPEHTATDILKIEGKFNTFLMSISKTPEKISGLVGTFNFMWNNTKVFYYYDCAVTVDQNNKEVDVPRLYYKNKTFFCGECTQKKCKNIEMKKAGFMFDNTYETKPTKDKTTLYSRLPADLVPEIHKTINYCNNNIRPNLLWVIFGIRR